MHMQSIHKTKTGTKLLQIIKEKRKLVNKEGECINIVEEKNRALHWTRLADGLPYKVLERWLQWLIEYQPNNRGGRSLGQEE